MAEGQGGRTGAGIALRYASTADVHRDRLLDVPLGVLVRTKLRVSVGDQLPVTLELEKERVTIHADGEVRWATPLVNGALAGLALHPVSHRDGVQLDLLFGVRTAGPPPERPAPAALAGATAAGEARPLSVAVLQPNAVLRQALVSALSRLGREKGPWHVSVSSVADPYAFLDVLSLQPRGLGIVDCDPLGPAADALVTAIRSHGPWTRLPLILLSSSGRSRLEDSRTVLMRKPFEVKAFMDLAGILVAAGA
jgi:hypothetical protein